MEEVVNAERVYWREIQAILEAEILQLYEKDPGALPSGLVSVGLCLFFLC